MPNTPFQEFMRSTVFSDQQIRDSIAERLPAWKRSCDTPGAEVVILNQGAFGQSFDDLLLLACAVKYAGLAGKEVTIVS